MKEFKVGDRVIVNSWFATYISINSRKGVVIEVIYYNSRYGNLNKVKIDDNPDYILFFSEELKPEKETIRTISDVDPYGEEDWDE